MLRASLLTAIITIGVYAIGNAADLSDDQVRRILITQSIASYSGNCPCPYYSDVRGRACGRRSAYSKQGGHRPLCYPSDVTDEMIAEYRRQP